tara:strand:- start:3438 stop:4148 length:711 start_codon:yes stop_codon:yes gene_type:complete
MTINSNRAKKKKFVDQVFNKVFNKYDLMNDIMSLGSHRLWKKKMISWLSPYKNSLLLDMASGTGDVAKLFLEYTNNKGMVYAVDPNLKMLEIAKKKLIKYKNIKWYSEYAEKLSFRDNYFDYYSISFGLRNTNNIDQALKEAHRVLKPGGRFICLEFSKIKNYNFKKIYELYSKSIPKIGNVIAGDDQPYEYLVKSIENFYSQRELVSLMKKNNFYKSEYRNLIGGIVAIHSGWKI